MKRINKRCPRCNQKLPINMQTCPNCELNFQKFNQATNKEAKQQMRAGNNDAVLLRTGLPSDVAKWKLLLMAIFLGFCGGHNYYVGRNKRGLAFSIFFLLGLGYSIVLTVLGYEPSGDVWQVYSFLAMGWAVVFVLWIVDVAKIALNKFKVPVSRMED